VYRERGIKGVGKFQINNVKMSLFLNMTKGDSMYSLIFNDT
jgi:hypothetical protein